MFEKIRIGILGTADIAKRMMMPALIRCNEFEVVGVASRSPDRAIDFAKRFKIRNYASYEELLGAQIDAIYIPLPNSLHYEWIKKSLNNELHVLVEKSMTCELVQTIELNALARSKGLVLIENFQFRFHSQMTFITNFINSGRLGELRNVRSCFGFPPFPDKDNIRYQKQLGGGALLDAGAYPIKITQLFLGRDIFVAGGSIAFTSSKEVDTWGSAFIKQVSGDLTSQIAFGFDNFYQNNLELWGTKGKVTATRIFTAGPGVRPELKVESVDGEEIIILPEDNHFLNMLNYFANCIRTKTNLEDEYVQNVDQARLLGELSDYAN